VSRWLSRLWTLASAPVLPVAAAGIAVHPRVRGELRGRLGLEHPPVIPGSVWIHGASVGEISAAEALASALAEPCLITADTDTGVARARRIALPGVVAAPRPLDHPWVIAPLWAEARPRALVFIEGTWYAGLARRASDAGIPVIRVSAKAGHRTRRFAGRWYRHWVAPTDLVLARDRDAASWFRTHQGAPVEVLGDLKASGITGANPLRWPRPFVVGASTREGDEAVLLDSVDGCGLLLAPRHPERFEAVAQLLDHRGVRWERRTRVDVDVAADVVLLDTLGELADCLVGAQAAFIGGTFSASIGGHSPLEAARAGVPVVCGPHIHSHEAAFRACGATVTDRRGVGHALRRARAKPIDTTVGARAASRILVELREPAPECAPRPWAAPLATGWRGVSRTRNALYDRGWMRAVRVGVPVLSVGSANSRGPGKTTTARWLAEIVRERGYRTGIALRGYRRSGRGLCVGGSVEELGDEGALFSEAGFLVAASSDRVAAAQALVDAGAEVVILDDGLQHRRLHRDLEIVVVDARYPEGRDLIPAGEGREAGIPDRADLVVVHHASEAFPPPKTGAPLVRVRRCPGPWSREGLCGPVAAFAGIGRPADFLEDLELDVARFRALPDHAPLDAQRLQELLAWAGDLPLVCTAKDAVRLPLEARARLWYRDVRLSGTLPGEVLDRVGLT